MPTVPAENMPRENLQSPEGALSRFQFTRASWNTDKESSIPLTREALGGKGFGLADIIVMGAPVPPEFTVTTGGWCEFHSAGDTIPEHLWQEISVRLRQLEQITGKRLGDPDNPLVVSVRSGAPVSMPGILHTVANIGLNDQTITALSREIGEHSAWEAYLELTAGMADHVYGMDTSSLKNKKQELALFGVQQVNELPLMRIQRLVQTAKERIHESGYAMPDDPTVQIREAVNAVFRSWDNPIAQRYRELNHIPDSMGTAVTIQLMVWGNSIEKGAGSGVFFTSDPHTLGPSVMDFVPHAQGAQVVGEEARFPNITDQLPPEQISLLKSIGTTLETHFGRPQDIEFTYDGHTLWILQTRDVQLSSVAWFRFIRENIRNGRLDVSEAQRLMPTAQLRSLLAPGLDPKAVELAINSGNLLASGIPRSPGVATAGWVDSIRAAEGKDTPVILNASVSIDDLVHLPRSVAGITAENGSIGSHIALDAIKIGTQKGIPIIFGATVHNIPPDSILTIDGNYGNVFLGPVPLQKNGHNGLITQEERDTARWWLETRIQNLWQFVGGSSDLKEQVTGIKQTLDMTGYANLRSLKAREIMVFNAAIPEAIRQTYTIVPRDTPENLVRTIEPILTRIFAHGNHATIRTCHNPALSADGPWALVRKMDDFERFLTDDQYSAKYGGFQQFLSHPQLTELLVGDIPPGKMENDPLIQHQHAAWTLSCTDNGEVMLQVRPHNPHLRTHEKETRDNLITFTTRYDSKSLNHLAPIQTEVGSTLAGDDLAKSLATIAKTSVLDTWWAVYKIPERMAAIADIFGINATLEGQVTEKWCLGYGIKTK